MDFSPLIPSDRQVIQSYGDGGFRISGKRYEGSVLLFPLQVLDWAVSAAEGITIGSLSAVADVSPPVEILLIGTGKQMTAIPAELRRHFRGLRVALEVMDTGAACRTYNVLQAEDRRVAAALVAVDS
jgi:uncharacterized protein